MRGAALFQQHHIPHSGATSRASQPAHQAPAIHHVTGRRCTSFLPPVRQQFSTSLTCQLLKDRQAASNRQQPAQQQHDHRRPMRTPTRMCGIIGIYKSQGPVNSEIYEGLLMLQHRGQDSAGMVTLEGQKFIEHKANGLVKDVFNNQKTMDKLKGSVGLGHVRYPTAGTSSVQEAQPFFVNSPLGMYLVHNGNITNTDELKVLLNSSSSFFNRYLRTNSDSEVLLNVLADEIHRAHQRCMQEGVQCNPTDRKMELVFEAGTSTMKLLKGAYSCISMIAGVGLVAFRDPFGIRTFAGVHRGTPRAALHRRTSTSERLDLHVLLRCMQPVLSSCAASCNDVKRPLVLGRRVTEGKEEWCVASEDCAFGPIGYKRVRDVLPGEMIVITDDGRLVSRMCAEETQTCPCLFEYIYLSRPDSVLNDMSVYNFQLGLGNLLSERLRKSNWDIDCVVPVPDGSRPAAIQISHELGLPYREGLVKNRYVGRTFIMPDQRTRELSVRRKLNAMPAVFQGKSVLLVDDSIVRGTTMRQIVDMVRKAGAKKVYLASASPPVRFPNVYGVDMPTKKEFVATDLSEDEICKVLGADGLLYQSVEDLLSVAQSLNPNIQNFEASCFTGHYITEDISAAYLQSLESSIRTQDRSLPGQQAVLVS